MLKKLLAFLVLGAVCAAPLGAMKRGRSHTSASAGQVTSPSTSALSHISKINFFMDADEVDCEPTKKQKVDDKETVPAPVNVNQQQSTASTSVATMSAPIASTTTSLSLSSSTNNNSNNQSSSSLSSSSLSSSAFTAEVVFVEKPWSVRSVASTASTTSMTTTTHNTPKTNNNSTSTNNSNGDPDANDDISTKINSQASSSSSSALSTSKTALGERPWLVKQAINSAFDKNKRAAGDWLYNGGHDYYGIMGLDEEKILEWIASKQDKNDIYIIDVGCARGGWGQKVAEFLINNKIFQSSGKRFHVFSVTGGNECMNMPEGETFCKTSVGNVTLYEFNQFKIENIDDEFKLLGFNLIGKVDLIVSHWTLRHLADPFGTLVRMYRLLTSAQGLLLSNGFLFAFENTESIEAFPGNKHWNILADANATPLFRYYDVGRDAGHFLLAKTNDKELAIPLEYTGEVRTIGGNYQCESGIVTVFKLVGLCRYINQYCFKENIKDEKDETDSAYEIWRDHGYYCDVGNQQSKGLYAYLRNKRFFVWQQQ